MAYTSTFNEIDGFVLVRLEGDINRTTAEDMSREALALGEQHHCDRYLLDWTEAHISASTLDVYTYALKQYELGLRRNDKVAIVMSADEDDKGDHGFFETVMLNRGWYNIRNFSDARSAAEWLKQA